MSPPQKVERRGSRIENRKRRQVNPALDSRRPALDRSLKRVKLFLCDVDGVLTDGMVTMGDGVETKRFNIRDGLGLRILQRNGIKVGWVSRRPSSATRQRADDLEIDFLMQGDGSKTAFVESILRQTGLNWSEVCYVGDDIVDLGVLNRAGVAVTVGDGVAEARAAADHVTRAAGGHGAVREMVELILKAQHKWNHAIAEYEEL
jgi:3-deoxy-D-manno-octulosonate 8-phosphate phosphatase (KDO 8-P phosphatase)